MPKKIGDGLSRREKEIMDILYEKGEATVAEVLDGIEDPISYSSVRATLRILVEKGHARYQESGKRYVYLPSQPRNRAAQSALKQVVKTFFSGSFSNAVKAFLADSDAVLTDEELASMAHMIEAARQSQPTDEKDDK